MNWLHYLAEANIYLGVFYLAYCLLLTKETYYQLTRAYLIFSCVVSFVLPVTQIGALKPVEIATSTTLNYTIPAIHTQTASQIIVPVIVEHRLSIQDYLWYSYLLGATIVLIILAIKLYTLFRLMRNANCVKQDNYKIVYLTGSDVAFSFFNYLFIGTNAAGADTITRHELVHIRQRHSADIIFLELLKIINWFNPFIYLLQNSLKTVHEYIADEQTAIYEQDALTYSSFLVNNAYGAGGSSITHSFFNYNLLKKRIIMLNQQRSGNLARLKYLVAVPICAGLLCASTLAFSKTYGWVDLVPARVSQKPHSIPPPPPPAPPAGHAKGEMPPPPMPTPIMLKSFYRKGFTDYIDANAAYPETARKKKTSGLVVLNFDLDNSGMIRDIKVAQKAGNGFDEAAVRLLQGYKKPINDNKGNHTISVVYYILGSKQQLTAGAETKKQPGYVGELVVLDRFPPPVVMADGKPVPPKPKVDQVKFPPPVVKIHDQVKVPPPVVRPDTIAKSITNEFYGKLERSIHYPAAARSNNTSGRVVLTFVVANNKIGDINILRTIGQSFSDELTRVLINYSLSNKLPAGKYVLPVAFVIADNKGNINNDAPATPSKETSYKGANGSAVPAAGTTYLDEVVIVAYSTQK